MLEYVLIFLGTLFLVYFIQCTIKPKKFPPGPRWYPFVGSSGKMYSMTQKHGSQFKALLEMSKEYCSDVLGLNLAGELLVVFFGEKHLKEVLSAEEFDGRPDSFFMKMRCLGQRAGISLVDGPLWKIHRRFTMQHLRNAGFGKGPMERDIGVGARELVDWITSQGNQALWPKDFLPLVILNILWKCAAGERIPTEKFEYLRQLLEKRGKAFNLAGGLLNRAPWIRFLLPRYSGYSMLVEVNQQISAIIEEAIKKHKDKKVDGHDFIYAFLDEMAQNRETFTDSQLVVTCIDLILAGSATTAHSLEFAILQVLRDQDIQRKLQEEIDQALDGKQVCMGDIARLPYTAAFLQECLRVYTIAPLIGPRRVLKETTVAGYVIPKNATVLLSTGDIHVDPAYWKDPLEFKPERFLDDSGRYVQSEHLYPFGLGRRRCPGETLARVFAFISLVTLLQQFNISSVGDQPPSAEPVVGMFASARRFPALFKPRQV